MAQKLARKTAVRKKPLSKRVINLLTKYGLAHNIGFFPRKKLKVSKPAHKQKTVLYLLPSATSHVVLQYEPSLVLTAIMPPAEHNVQVDYGKDGTTAVNGVVKTPTLAWSQLFAAWKTPHNNEVRICECFECRLPNSLKLAKRSYCSKEGINPYRYFVHQVNLDKSTDEHFEGAPFSIANIDDGYVCWGSNIYPYSLRQACFVYWGSILNNSPRKYPILGHPSSAKQSEELLDFIQKYEVTEFENLKSFFFGRKFLATDQPAQAILLSLDEGLIKQHRASVISSPGGHDVLLGFANRDSRTAKWVIDTSEETLLLREKDIIIR